MKGTTQEAYEAGRSRWPGIKLDEADFVAGTALVSSQDLAARGPELFLALACALGDAEAQQIFDREYMSAVTRHVARLRLSAAQIDEVRQTLSIRMLTGTNPRIRHYDGRAPLDAWVRVITVRIGLDVRDKDQRQSRPLGGHELGDQVLAGADPELMAIKGRLREPFQRALDESLSALGPREKTLLRMHFVDGLNIDAIGKVMRVHRATVARWLVSIRREVFDTIRRRLNLRSAPTPSEFRSMVRMVAGDLKVSVERVLPG